MTRLFIPHILSFFSLLAIASCNSAENSNIATENESEVFNIDTARKEIDKANLEFVELFNKSDSIGLANMFTSDGKSMEPNEPAFVGRKAIQNHYSLVMNAGANTLGLVTTGLWQKKENSHLPIKVENYLTKGNTLYSGKLKMGNGNSFATAIILIYLCNVKI